MGGAGRIELCDLSLSDDGARTEELCAAVARVARSGRFVLGPAVERFEHALAAALGVEQVVGVGSGSDALLLALLGAGVEPGDVVVTTPLSFLATAEAIVRAGAIPRFVDVDPVTLCLSPDALAAYLDACRSVDGALRERSGGARVRAVLPVHLYGRVAEVARLRALCAPAGLVLVHDAAQAIGAREPAGPLGRHEPGCLSFFPTKNLGAWGDGGAVLCPDWGLADRVRALRAHGVETARGVEAARGPQRFIGLNSRLDAIQAAVLEVKLGELGRVNGARARHAAAYAEAWVGQRARLEGRVTPPPPLGPGDVCHLYTVRIAAGRRDAVAAALDRAGIGTRVYYRTLLCDEPALAPWREGRDLALPHARAATAEVLSLPVHERLAPGDVARVAEALGAAVA